MLSRFTEKEKKYRDGVGIRDLREARGGGRTAPHAGSSGVDHCEGVAERAEGGGGAVRGDRHLGWFGPPEDEVHEVSPQAHEHQALPWPYPLPRPFKDPLAYHSWVRSFIYIGFIFVLVFC